jgi:hypothetical protein
MEELVTQLTRQPPVAEERTELAVAVAEEPRPRRMHLLKLD